MAGRSRPTAAGASHRPCGRSRHPKIGGAIGLPGPRRPRRRCGWKNPPRRPAANWPRETGGQVARVICQFDQRQHQLHDRRVGEWIAPLLARRQLMRCSEQMNHSATARFRRTSTPIDRFGHWAANSATRRAANSNVTRACCLGSPCGGGTFRRSRRGLLAVECGANQSCHCRVTSDRGQRLVGRQIGKHPIDRVDDHRTGAIALGERLLADAGQFRLRGVERLRHAAPPTVNRLLDVSHAKEAAAAGLVATGQRNGLSTFHCGNEVS